jgi:hypothetical protein
VTGISIAHLAQVCGWVDLVMNSPAKDPRFGITVTAIF